MALREDSQRRRPRWLPAVVRIKLSLQLGSTGPLGLARLPSGTLAFPAPSAWWAVFIIVTTHARRCPRGFLGTVGHRLRDRQMPEVCVCRAVGVMSPFYRWENGGLQKLWDVPNVSDEHREEQHSNAVYDSP